MFTKKYLNKLASDIFSECISEIDIIHQTEYIRRALHPESETYKSLSILKSQINRLINSDAKGIISRDDFESKITKISMSIVDTISDSDVNEYVVEFDFELKDGIFYNINDVQGSHRFKFLGNLKNNMPNGSGIALYTNGNYYEGNFKKGLRDGLGVLYNKDRVKIKEGEWKNDKYLPEDSIEFYPDIKIAASVLTSHGDLLDYQVEQLQLPYTKKKGLVAFPVEGDSMEPIIYEGDIVICEKIKDESYVLDNKIYVIFHEENSWVKYIQKSRSLKLKNELFLISQNHLKHRQITIELNNKTKLLRVVRIIKNL